MFVLCIFVCNAQNNSDMIKEPEICGGYRSNNRTVSPIENVKGEVEELYCVFYDGINTYASFLKYELNLDSANFKANISREGCYEPFKFNTENSPNLKKKLSDALKNSGLFKFNNWSVHVNGLPPIVEFFISAKFSTGEKFYMEFNGGRSPRGFEDAVNAFSDEILQLTGYTPEKCNPSKPYVNPFLGRHHFVYSKNGKLQHFDFILENTTGIDNAEVISTGDFGDFHARCNASKVSGRYHFSLNSYYDDSKIKNVSKNSLTGIIYSNAGKLYLEPLQAAPSLTDRTGIAEDK